MKIIISATSNTIETAFSPRFGRADYFILIDHDSQRWEAFANPAVEARGGAGPLGVSFLGCVMAVEAVLWNVLKGRLPKSLTSWEFWKPAAPRKLFALPAD